jgi:hypothetical protein
MEVGEALQREMKEKGKGLEMNMPANVINLQRCLMTLNGVASATGAGNPRPSAMWRKQADALLAREDGARR